MQKPWPQAKEGEGSLKTVEANAPTTKKTFAGVPDSVTPARLFGQPPIQTYCF